MDLANHAEQPFHRSLVIWQDEQNVDTHGQLAKPQVTTQVLLGNDLTPPGIWSVTRGIRDDSWQVFSHPEGSPLLHQVIPQLVLQKIEKYA